MSSLPMLDTPDVFSDDARSSSMSTQEKLVSVNDDEKRNVQSVWYDIATFRPEPVDTLSKTFASTLRGLPVNGPLVCRGNVNTVLVHSGRVRLVAETAW